MQNHEVRWAQSIDSKLGEISLFRKQIGRNDMDCSRQASWRLVAHRLILMIFPLAFLLFLLFPQDVRAHPILLRSEPNKLDILTASPTRIRMWFSEDLNPAFSTTYVINAVHSAANVQKDVNTDVDKDDARVSANDPKDMD